MTEGAQSTPQVGSPQVRSPSPRVRKSAVRESAVRGPRSTDPDPDHETHVLVSAACFDVPARPWSFFSLLCCCRLAHRFVPSRRLRPSRRPVRRRRSVRRPAPTSCAASTAATARTTTCCPTGSTSASIPERKFISGTNTHPLPHARGRHADSAGALRQPGRRRDHARRHGADLRARAEHRLRRLSRRRSRPAASTPSTSTTQARRAKQGRFGGIAFRKDPDGQAVDQHRLRGRGLEHLVAEQGSVARRGRGDGDAASRSRTT